MFCQLFSLQNKSFLCLQHVENKGFQTVIKHRLKAIQKPIKNELGNREKNTENAHFVLKKCTFRFRDYNMRQNESFTIRLKALLSRLDDMQGNYSSDEDKALSDLDEIKEELEEINEQLFHFEDHLYTGDKDPNYFVKKAEECRKARKLSNRIEQKNVNLRREITGYDEREIMQMMYPNEDVDSEDFEDGFDIEDFYDED